MKQQTGHRSLVAHVNGEDSYHHFTVASAPKGRPHVDDFELCRQDVAIKRSVLYAGVEDKAGQRY